MNEHYNYANVRTWTRAQLAEGKDFVNLFEKDKVFIPVHLHQEDHWAMLVIYMGLKEIHYYDSMAKPGRLYLDGALRYLGDEALDKAALNGNVRFEASEWMLFDQEPFVPQQWNIAGLTDKGKRYHDGFECGPYALNFADYGSDDLPFDFNEKDMPGVRERILCAILSGELRYPDTHPDT